MKLLTVLLFLPILIVNSAEAVEKKYNRKPSSQIVVLKGKAAGHLWDMFEKNGESDCRGGECFSSGKASISCSLTKGEPKDLSCEITPVQ